MIRCNGFARSLAFGAAAALGCAAWALLVSPIVGPWNAQALYLIGVTALYIAGLCHTDVRAVGAALVAVVAAGAAALAVRTTAELALCLAVILGVARGAVLYPVRPARAIARELVLLAGGLVFARFLTAATVPSTALALWGFFLIQSCFFLIPGTTRPSRPTIHPDPFEEAHRRAIALLDSA